MKRIFTILLMLIMLFSLTGCGGNEATDTDSKLPANGSKITAQEAQATIDADKDIMILDIRNQEAYDTKHIANAVLLPSDEIKEKAAAVLPNKDQTILVYCNTGKNTAGAVAELVKMGYTKVYDMGGIQDWTGEAVTAEASAPANGSKITAQEAQATIDADKDIMILDIRNQEAYDTKHIANAVLLPSDEIKEKAAAVLPNKDQTILVYCNTGKNTAGVVAELVKMGYTKVYDMGGIQDWTGAVVE